MANKPQRRPRNPDIRLDILAFIYRYKLKNDRSPTLDEIGLAVDRVKSVVNRQIAMLMADGLATRIFNAGRTITLTEAGKRLAIKHSQLDDKFEPIVILTPERVGALRDVLAIANMALAQPQEPVEFSIVQELIDLGTKPVGAK